VPACGSVRAFAVRDVIVSLTHNKRILRVVCAYALFTVNEYSVWIAVLVFAYAKGGATEAGLVAVAQLVPAGLCAPFMAVRADRSSPTLLLLYGFGAQVAGLAVAAVGVLHGWPSAYVYAGAVIAATAITATRPAQAALLPSLARTPDELTAANVAMSWVESIGVAVAGVWSAALLTHGVGQVLVAAIGLLAVAAWLVAVDARREPPRADSDEATRSTWSEVVDGARAVREAPGAGTLIALLAAEDIVLGALDVLFVVTAIGVLHRSQSWVGYLNGAYGLGGVLVGAAMFVLIGRRLPVPILMSSLLLGLCIAAIPINGSAAAAVVLLGAVGAARGVMDMSTRTLLQRSVAPDVLGRVFGLVEGLTMMSVAVGSMIVALLVLIGGADAALIGVGCILPTVAILSAARLLRLDRESRIPIVEITLLRSVDMFASLPPKVIESLARSLVPVRLNAGYVLIREGDRGDAYFTVADGRLAVSQAGRVLSEVGRGVGIGEIALLRDVPRTATVTALHPSLVYALPREMFLGAITGHAPSRSVAETKVARTLDEDGARLSALGPQ
jgi:Cyclic nucleotide-binding domain